MVDLSSKATIRDKNLSKGLPQSNSAYPVFLRYTEPGLCSYCFAPLNPSERVYKVPDYGFILHKEKNDLIVDDIVIVSAFLRPICALCYDYLFSGEDGQQFLRDLEKMRRAFLKGRGRHEVHI